jgi:antitoxin ParD1/3/4
MRNTMHISLPTPLKKWVEQQVQQRGFATASEFMRDLLRQQQERERRVRERIEEQLLEGLDSGPGTPMTRKDWADIRREGKKRATARKKA